MQSTFNWKIITIYRGRTQCIRELNGFSVLEKRYGKWKVERVWMNKRTLKVEIIKISILVILRQLCQLLIRYSEDTL